MKRLLCFGNEFLEQDSLAKEIADQLDIEDCEVIKCDYPDQITSYPEDEKLYLLDVVKNAKEIIVIDDISRLKTNEIASLHDFDLGYFLKILKSIGELPRIKIIGIPSKAPKKELVKLKKQIKEIIEQC